METMEHPFDRIISTSFSILQNCFFFQINIETREVEFATQKRSKLSSARLPCTNLPIAQCSDSNRATCDIVCPFRQEWSSAVAERCWSTRWPKKSVVSPPGTCPSEKWPIHFESCQKFPRTCLFKCKPMLGCQL